VKDEQAATPGLPPAMFAASAAMLRSSLGDPDSGIAPGTKFEDLPETWTCPVCGAEKSKFEKE